MSCVILYDSLAGASITLVSRSASDVIHPGSYKALFPETGRGERADGFLVSRSLFDNFIHMQTFALQPSSGGCRLRKTGNFLSFLPHSPLILSREQQFPPSPSYPLPSYSSTLERASFFSAFHTRPEWKDLLFFSLSLRFTRLFAN